MAQVPEFSARKTKAGTAARAVIAKQRGYLRGSPQSATEGGFY